MHATGAPVDRAELARLVAAMAYCAPDGREVWTDGEIGLGHALLAPDPEPDAAERQPCTLDGDAWVAADARVDGRGDLVARLRTAGRAVDPAAPDAALILHAYAAWGERCVEHLIGDFAFALWDARSRRLFCARDRFGVVPLYYAEAGATLVVGNVLRTLRLHPLVSAAVNERAIGDFLLFGMNMDLGATAFADIRAVPPAATLSWSDGRVSLRRYWRPPAERPESRDRDHVERFTVAFDAAVADRLRSSRAAAHLSGGMDSSSVVATARRLLAARGGPFELYAYTVVFDRLADEEEGRYADETAGRLGIGIEHVVADDYVKRPPGSGGWAFPEPSMVAAHEPLYEIGRRAATRARVLLTGFGGDPLLNARLAWPAGAGEWRALLERGLHDLRRGRLPRYGIRSRLRARTAARRGAVPDWIDPGFARRVDLDARRREVAALWRGADEGWKLQHPTWANLFAWSHPGARGLPLRNVHPFFDVRVVEAAWRAPRDPWLRDKRLLRVAMRGRVPRGVLERPKTALYVPRARAQDSPLDRIARVPEVRRWRSDLLATAAIREYVDVQRVGEVTESRGDGHAWPPVERCFTLAHWLDAVRADTEETSYVRDPSAA